MTKLCKCDNCSCTFRSLKNLSKHRNSKHKNSVAAKIRNGIKNSPNTPRAKNEKLINAVRDIAGLVAAITPAIVTRRPELALAAADDLKKVIDSVRELTK